VHAGELVLRGMARDMHEGVVFGDDLDAEPGEAVLQPADGAFIAGNDARGKDHGVASSSTILGCSSSAMRASAQRGSPWLPVQMSSTLSRGRYAASSSVRKGWTSFKYPVSRAACSMRQSERPTRATWRSCAAAAAAADSRRATFEAKQAMATRFGQRPT